MDPAGIIGIVAASAQFADNARKLARLVKEIHAGTEVGPTRRRLVQLETWAEVAEKIRDSGDQNDPQTEKIMKQCIPTVQALADQLGRIRISEADGRREKTRKALMARWEKDDIAELFAQLHRDQMTLLTYRNFASEGHFLRKIRESMGSLLDERLRYSEHDGQSILGAQVLGAIFVTDPRDDRSALIHRKTPRAEGTCIWITKKAEFLEWVCSAARSPGLVVEGGPGKGKSMIAIYLTEYLEQLTQTSEANTESVIYFFCDNRNPKQNSALAVIRCLMWQLCQLRPHLLLYGVKEAKARGNAEHLLEPPAAAFETIWRIFVNMLNDDRAGTISCVIDGLDECDEGSILSILTKFQGLMTGQEVPGRNFKFIILSRPLSSRCRPPALRTHLMPKIHLDPELNKDDITVFIEKRVDELAESSNRPWRSSLRRKVKETLLKKAGGTFLWVGFIADNLHGKSAFEVNSCLRTLPLGLHGVYDRILLGMPVIHRFKIRSILHWICLAHRPLRKTELVGLVHSEKDIDDDTISDANSCMTSDSDRGGTPDADPGTDMDELEGLLEYCKPIIRVAYDDTIHFVHQSVKDYLMRTHSIGDTDLEYFMVSNVQLEHEELGLRCIEIILERHQEVQSHRISRDDSNLWTCNTTHSSFTFLEYASVYWAHHIRLSGTEYQYSTTTDKVLQIIDDTGGLREAWYHEYAHSVGKCQCQGGFKDASTGKGRVTTLNLAITLGLGTTVRQLLRSMSIDDYVSDMRLDLLRGNEWLRSQSVPRWRLHEKGVVRGHFLKLAIKHHQRHIVKVILNRYGSKAVFNEAGSLSTAVKEGDRKTIQLLLALQPSPREVHGKDLDAALAATASRIIRYDDGVPLATELINAGADPLVGSGVRLLKLLARITWSEAVFVLAQLLLKSGLDIADNTPDSWTPLHHAALAANFRMAALLLQWGAPVDAVDKRRRTPLHLAAISGNGAQAVNVLDLLISAGRTSTSQSCAGGGMPGACWHIDRQDSNGRSALYFASHSAAPAALEVLLKAGANSRLKDDEGQTPLGTLFNDDEGRTPLGALFNDFDTLLDERVDEGYTERRITCIHLLRHTGAAGID